MAVVETRQRRILLPGPNEVPSRVVPSLSSEGDMALARSVGDAGNSLANIANNIKRDEAIAYKDKKITEFEARILAEYDSATVDNNEKPKGFSKRRQDYFDSLSSDLYGDSPSRTARRLLQRSVSDFGRRYQAKTLSFEAQALQIEQVKQREEAAQVRANIARTHPEEEFQIIKDQHESNLASGLPPKLKKDLAKKSENAIWLSAANGWLEQDPKYLLDRINNDFYSDKLSPTQIESLRKSAMSETRQSNLMAIQLLNERRTADLSRGLVDGELSKLTYENFAVAYGEGNEERAAVEYRRHVIEMHDSLTLHGNLESLKVNSTSNNRANVEALRPLPNDPVHDRKMNIYYKTAQLQAQDEKHRIEDPVGYTIVNSPAVEQAWNRSAEEGISASLTLQDDLKINPLNQRVLPVATAKQEVFTLEQARPNELVGHFTNLKAKYGKYYNEALSEMFENGLNPGFIVAPTLEGEPAWDVYVQSLQIPADELLEQAKIRGETPDSVTTQSEQATVAFTEILTLNAEERLPYANAITNVVRNMGIVRATQANIPVSDGIEWAAKKVIEDKYDLDGGTYYVPKTTTIKGDTEIFRVDPNMVHRNLKALKHIRHIEAFDPDLDATISNEQEVDEVLKHGIWLNDGEGRSVSLWVDMGDGYRQVHDSTGLPYSFSFAMLGSSMEVPSVARSRHDEQGRWRNLKQRKKSRDELLKDQNIFRSATPLRDF